jgi:hypothetical protein
MLRFFSQGQGTALYFLCERQLLTIVKSDNNMNNRNNFLDKIIKS